MKLFLKNCFLVLLCLYRSHQTTPFRGQGAKTSTEQGIKAITYIGSHYPCLLAKLLKLSHLMIKIKQISRPPFPPTHIFHQKVKSCLSFLASRFYSSRYSGQDFVSWLLVKSRLSLLASRFFVSSRLSASPSWLLSLVFCFSNLKPRFSHLASKTSPLASLTLLLLLSPKVALTQTYNGAESNDSAPQRVQPIDVGDKVPELMLTNVINYPEDKINLQDVKGKVLILDFWTTWCSPCIASLTKTQNWNKKYAKDIMILPVTYEDRSKVEKLLAKISKSNGTTFDMPMVVSNNTLSGFFPHKAVPHYVWIDRAGTVAAITGMEEFTEENLQNAIEGNFSQTLKSDVITPFNSEEGLLLGNNQVMGRQILFQSALIKYIPGWSGKYFAFKKLENGTARLLAINGTMISLFIHAFNGDYNGTIIGLNRLELEDPSMLDYMSYDVETFNNWMSGGGGFCYELIIPEDSWDRRYDIFKEELKRFFPEYIVDLEPRVRKVLVLKEKGEGMVISSGGKPFITRSPMEFKMVNGPIKRLPEYLAFLTLQKEPRPLIYDLDGEKRVDIHLDGNLTSVEEINNMLIPYGMEIIEDDREIDVLVIKRKQNLP